MFPSIGRANTMYISPIRHVPIRVMPKKDTAASQYDCYILSFRPGSRSHSHRLLNLVVHPPITHGHGIHEPDVCLLPSCIHTYTLHTFT
jgi:hypothetical protein